jgi:hypothetical protein
MILALLLGALVVGVVWITPYGITAVGALLAGLVVCILGAMLDAGDLY